MAQLTSMIDVLKRVKQANKKPYTDDLYNCVTSFIEKLPISPNGITLTGGGKKYQIIDFDDVDGFYADVWVGKEEGEDIMYVEVEFDMGSKNANRVKNSGEAYKALERLNEIEKKMPYNRDKYYLMSDDHKYVNKMSEIERNLTAEKNRILSTLC